MLYFKSLGFQIGSGNLVGMPQQSVKDIADDIILCKELDVDMASFSPFIPSPNTPYRNQLACDINSILKAMAVGRIVLKIAISLQQQPLAQWMNTVEKKACR